MKQQRKLSKLPKKKEIDEYDLSRPIPQIGADDIKLIYEASMDESMLESCVGLKGPVLEEINIIMLGGLKKTEEKEQSDVSSDQNEGAGPKLEENSAPALA